MSAPKKWIERIVGENTNNYLVTTTNFAEHRERAPKWLPKTSISTENISDWQKLRHAIQTGLDAAQHDRYSPYTGEDQVAVYTDGDLFAYVDILPLGRSMRTALGGKNSSLTVHYYAHSRFLGNGQAATAAALDEATQPCQEPANLNVEHQEPFYCTSTHHGHNLVTCKACSAYAMAQAIEAGKENVVEHGANLPLCFECASAHLNYGSKICTCFQNKCVQCVHDTAANMEIRKYEMEHATNFGEWCLDCLADVNGFAEGYMDLVLEGRAQTRLKRILGATPRCINRMCRVMAGALYYR